MFLKIMIVMFSLLINCNAVPANTAVVYDLDYTNNEIIVMDVDGNLWSIAEIEEWEIGDLMSIEFNDMGTEMVEDDEIVSFEWMGQNVFDFK